MDSQTIPPAEAPEAQDKPVAETPLPTTYKETTFQYAPPGISPPHPIYQTSRRFTLAHLIASAAGGMVLAGLLLLAARWALNIRAAAIVDGQKISRGQLGAQLATANSPKMLKDMVAERAILQEAKRKGALPTDAQINEAIQTSERDDPGLKLRVIQGAVKNKDLRDEARWKLALQNLMTLGVKVGPDDARRFFNTHPGAFNLPAQARARVVLATTPDKAAQARQMLQSGTSYSVISTTPGLKMIPGQRGDGIVTITHGHGRTAVDQFFDAQIFKLSPASPISQPFKVGKLYSVVELLGKTPGRQVTFDEAQQQVIRYLKLSKGLSQAKVLAEVQKDIPVQYRGRYAFLKDEPLFQGLPAQGAK